MTIETRGVSQTQIIDLDFCEDVSGDRQNLNIDPGVTWVSESAVVPSGAYIEESVSPFGNGENNWVTHQSGLDETYLAETKRFFAKYKRSVRAKMAADEATAFGGSEEAIPWMGYLEAQNRGGGTKLHALQRVLRIQKSFDAFLVRHEELRKYKTEALGLLAGALIAWAKGDDNAVKNWRELTTKEAIRRVFEEAQVKVEERIAMHSRYRGDGMEMGSPAVEKNGGIIPIQLQALEVREMSGKKVELKQGGTLSSTDGGAMPDDRQPKTLKEVVAFLQSMKPEVENEVDGAGGGGTDLNTWDKWYEKALARSGGREQVGEDVDAMGGGAEEVLVLDEVLDETRGAYGLGQQMLQQLREEVVLPVAGALNELRRRVIEITTGVFESPEGRGYVAAVAVGIITIAITTLVTQHFYHESMQGDGGNRLRDIFSTFNR